MVARRDRNFKIEKKIQTKKKQKRTQPKTKIHCRKRETGERTDEAGAKEIKSDSDHSPVLVILSLSYAIQGNMFINYFVNVKIEYLEANFRKEESQCCPFLKIIYFFFLTEVKWFYSLFIYYLIICCFWCNQKIGILK